MYEQKYHKYKNKYLSLKRDNGETSQISRVKNTNKYIFYKPQLNEQKNIFAKYYKEITKIFFQYITHERNTTKKSDNEELDSNLLNTIKSHMNKFQAYFVKSGEKIIGLCFLVKKMEFIKSNVPLETYKTTIVDNDEEYVVKLAKEKDCVIMKKELYNKISNNVVVRGPVITELCKNKKYSNVGSFLLKNIFEDLKKRYDSVYLAVESIIHKDNLSSIVYLNNCIFKDTKLYIEDNKKLLNYYLSLGFHIDATLYSPEACISPGREMNLPNFYSNAFILYPVLTKQIK